MKGAERFSLTHMPRAKKETSSLSNLTSNQTSFTGNYLSFPSKLIDLEIETRQSYFVPLANVSLGLCK